MAPLPALTSATVRAIYAAYEADNESWDSLGISVGELGTECDRALFYSFRWATPVERVEGRIVRIFRRGDLEEQRLIEDLERIGVEVFGFQDKIRLVSGHVRGKIDGRATGIPEAPITEHLCEFKSSNAKNFALLLRDKVRVAEPKHYVQCQLGMHALGLTRALYLNTNKDTEEIHAERLEYDFEFCSRLLARAERLIRLEAPPSRISENPDFFGCRFCKHKAVCHQSVFPRVTCRSCLHSSPEFGGSGHWSCARFSKPLGFDEQKEACPAHLFFPSMVPGVQVDSNPDEETVTYKMVDGSSWTDGQVS